MSSSGRRARPVRPTGGRWCACTTCGRATAAADARGQAEEGRKEELRAAVLGVLPADHPAGLTREEIWAALPQKVRVNEPRFKAVMEAGAGKSWRREGNGGRGGYRYRRGPMVTQPAEEEVGG